MLKIKDNFDLKELEKIGYKLTDDSVEYCKFNLFGENNEFCISSIRILNNDINIYKKGLVYRAGENLLNFFPINVDLNLEDADIQDIVQAGLVEKVES